MMRKMLPHLSSRACFLEMNLSSRQMEFTLSRPIVVIVDSSAKGLEESAGFASTLTSSEAAMMERSDWAPSRNTHKYHRI